MIRLMRIILFLAGMILVPAGAGADPLQFKIAVSDGTSYASFAEVKLLNTQNQQVFRGSTDRYGRINAAIPAGQYRAIVVTSGESKEKMIRLRGTKKLQVVTLD